MRNLARISNYYNRIQALEDYAELGTRAIALGLKALADKHTPGPDAGWRTIDKCIAKLRKDMEAERTK